MPSYLDLLPDDVYQSIYRHIMNECVSAVAEQCSLNRKHRTMNGWHSPDDYPLPYRHQKSNVAAVWSWLNGEPKRAHRMWTDGQTIYSYNLPIGFTRPDGYKIYHSALHRTQWKILLTDHQFTQQFSRQILRPRCLRFRTMFLRNACTAHLS